MPTFAANYSFDNDGFLRLQRDLNYHINSMDSENVLSLSSSQVTYGSALNIGTSTTLIAKSLVYYNDAGNAVNISMDAAGAIEINSFKGVSINSTGDGISLNSTKICFFGNSPVAKTTISNLSTASTNLAGAVFSTAYMTIINSLINKNNELMDILRNYNLV